MYNPARDARLYVVQELFWRPRPAAPTVQTTNTAEPAETVRKPPVRNGVDNHRRQGSSNNRFGGFGPPRPPRHHQVEVPPALILHLPRHRGERRGGEVSGLPRNEVYIQRELCVPCSIAQALFRMSALLLHLPRRKVREVGLLGNRGIYWPSARYRLFYSSRWSFLVGSLKWKTHLLARPTQQNCLRGQPTRIDYGLE